MRLLIPLFSPASGTWGGMTRGLAIGEAAAERGHEVAFCGSGHVEESLRRRGHRVYPTPATTMLGLPRPLSRRMVDRAQQRALPVRPGTSLGSLWLVLMVTGLARAGHLGRAVDAELRAVADFRADAIFSDLDPAAYLTAAIGRLPIAGAYSEVMKAGTGTVPWRLMRRSLNAVLEDHGLPGRDPEELLFGPDVLKIVPSVPELDEADPARPDVLYVGSLLGEIRPGTLADSGLEPEARFVFGYVGTGSVRLDTLERVLPEVFPAGGPTTCVIGAQSVTAPYRVGGVEFRPYVPADAILPHCDWVICHGGQNTIAQSLLHGVPLIMFPGGIFERRYNAQHVQQAKAGVMGESDQLTAGWLRWVLDRRAEFAPRAAELGARIRALGGAGAAVEAIESRVAALAL